MVYILKDSSMQRVIDYYFLIVCSIISLFLIFCCFFDNSRTTISLTALSVWLVILFTVNVFKPSLFSRIFVRCIELAVSILMAIFLPLFIIIAYFKYEITLYLAIAFGVLNIILALTNIILTFMENRKKSVERFFAEQSGRAER